MSDAFWRAQRVVVTGGAGFLGSRVVERLRSAGCAAVTVPRSRDTDLRDPAAQERLLRDTRPTLLIHLAARVGGIGANQATPGTFFHDNAIMGIHLIEAARRHGVGKLVIAGTVCAYPAETPAPFKEDDLWNGYPEPTNAGYGLAKRMLLAQSWAYRQQYGLNSIFLLPANLYGPGDNFDLETSHVIPAMIRKFSDAKAARAKTVTLWGTGAPTREFLYVDDAAEGIVAAAERYDKPEPVNLGTGRDVSIRDLAGMIQQAVGYEGGIVWDASRPDGQRVRRLSTERAEREFGFRARTSLEDGLRATVAWYVERHASPAMTGSSK